MGAGAIEGRYSARNSLADTASVCHEETMKRASARPRNCCGRGSACTACAGTARESECEFTHRCACAVRALSSRRPSASNTANDPARWPSPSSRRLEEEIRRRRRHAGITIGVDRANAGLPGVAAQRRVHVLEKAARQHRSSSSTMSVGYSCSMLVTPSMTLAARPRLRSRRWTTTSANIRAAARSPCKPAPAAPRRSVAGTIDIRVQ